MLQIHQCTAKKPYKPNEKYITSGEDRNSSSNKEVSLIMIVEFIHWGLDEFWNMEVKERKDY